MGTLKISKGDYVYRTEDHRHRDGSPELICYRRRVLNVERDRINLDGVQRAEIVNGEPPDWHSVGGLLGRGTWLTWVRARASGYSDKQPKEARL